MHKQPVRLSIYTHSIYHTDTHTVFIWLTVTAGCPLMLGDYK